MSEWLDSCISIQMLQNSIYEQGLNAGGNSGVSGDKVLGLRGEIVQNDGVFST